MRFASIFFIHDTKKNLADAPGTLKKTGIHALVSPKATQAELRQVLNSSSGLDVGFEYLIRQLTCS
jgi:hypothetical protein